MSWATNWKSRLVSIVIVSSAMLQGCRAEQPWPLWQKYCDHFYDAQQGRIIDHTSEDRSTSEGQAYALFFALVVNDPAKFERILHWTEDNMAGGDLSAHLPAWKWGKASDGSWKVLDSNSAADADLWLAYDLLEAGRLWKNARYTSLGNVIANHVAQTEVAEIPGLGKILLPGPQGFQHAANEYVVNPSYMPPQVLARLAAIAPKGEPWLGILHSYPRLLAQGSGGGFVMDWVTVGNGIKPSAAPQEIAEGKKDAIAIGSYDAIRVYLWLGMADRATAAVQESLPEIGGMANYLKAHVTPPLQVDGTGKVINESGTTGFSAAVTPYLLMQGKKTEATQQQERLDATQDPATGLYGHPATYYDQNLALFATGWGEQRFHFDRNGMLKVKW